MDDEVQVFLPYSERAACALIAGGVLNSVICPPQVAEHPAVRGVADVRTMASWPATYRRTLERVLPHSRALAGMNQSKMIWTRQARAEVDRKQSILTFPGASLEIYREHHAPKIFHAVDAHPTAHNQSLHGVKARAEVHPRWWVARIAEELSLASVILAPSSRVADQMVTNGVTSRKIEVVPYGVDLDLFSPRTDDRVAHHPSGELPSAIFVGQLSMRKGIDVLLEASDAVVTSIVVVGNRFSPPSRAAHFPANVRLVDPKSHTELRRMYLDADVFILPTREDACSLVALEAAATGLPIITTAANGAREVLASELLDIVEPGSAEELAACLRKVPKLDWAMRVANRAAHLQAGLYDWGEYARAVEDVLRTRHAL